MKHRKLYSTAAIAIPVIVAASILALRSPNDGTPTPAARQTQTGEGRGPASAMGADQQALCGNFYRAVCQKRGVTRDPTGAVRPDVDGEVRALRIYQEVIRKHPEWTTAQIDEVLVKTIYTPKRRARVQKAYEWVVGALEAYVNRQPDSVFTSREKRQITTRLKATELQLPPPAAMYKDEPDLFTKTDVYYERTFDGKLRMRFGGAYLLMSKSWFNMVFTLAHELAHSIDPCEVRSAGLSFPAYDRLSACFLKQGLIAARTTRAECGRNDQLSETFADWIASQISAEAIRGFAPELKGLQLVNAATNSVRDLCEQDEFDSDTELDSEYHPEPSVRIGRIFGENPLIREALSCAAPAKPTQYCGFDFSQAAPHPTETRL